MRRRKKWNRQTVLFRWIATTSNCEFLNILPVYEKPLPLSNFPAAQWLVRCSCGIRFREVIDRRQNVTASFPLRRARESSGVDRANGVTAG